MLLDTLTCVVESPIGSPIFVAGKMSQPPAGERLRIVGHACEATYLSGHATFEGKANAGIHR